MKSPFTGGEALLQREERSMNFRKDAFLIQFQYYLCVDSGEQFTDALLDEANINQVYNQYREKYGIPFPDEIKSIREQYDLSASKMSEILGLGINVYRNYELGEVPSVSNGRLIQLVKDPVEFKRLMDYSKNEFTPEEQEKINRKIDQSLHGWNETGKMYEILMLGEKRPGLFNGYKVPDIHKINNMVLFFAERIAPFKTKMNKLLFYADFLHFKRTCFSISGLSYQAIRKGPVPKNYDWIFDNTMQQKMVTISLHVFGNYLGEKFHPAGETSFDATLFTEAELHTMNLIADAFKKDTVGQLVSKSHEEEAWKDNVGSLSMISYVYGFGLKYPVI
jgi:transcriptional regulator with XRE-family HTH domain